MFPLKKELHLDGGCLPGKQGKNPTEKCPLKKVDSVLTSEVASDSTPVPWQSGGGGEGEGVNPKRSRAGTSGEEKLPGQKNKALLNLEDCMKGLTKTQIRDQSVQVEEGLMTLLKRCLELNREGSCFVVISGNIEHFESKKDADFGWGCGWRNIQMLSSYLLAEEDDAREVMFGGAGFVPDIPALQQWLEIAWAKGFDIPGGEYFDWKIWGTHKWIGTTEGAALLRSFGLRAQIVDFQNIGGKRVGFSARAKTGQGSLQSAGEDDRSDESNPEKPDQGNDGGQEPGKQQSSSSLGDEEQEFDCVVCGEHQLRSSEFRQNNKSDLCPVCTGDLKDSSDFGDEGIRRRLQERGGQNGTIKPEVGHQKRAPAARNTNRSLNGSGRTSPKALTMIMNCNP